MLAIKAEAAGHVAHLHVGLVLVDFDNLSDNTETANADKLVHEGAAHVGGHDDCGKARQDRSKRAHSSRR